MTTPSPTLLAAVLREVARAIARVQLNGGDPDQPAVRWNGTEMEPQEFPAWHDYQDEARAAIAAMDRAGAEGPVAPASWDAEKWMDDTARGYGFESWHHMRINQDRRIDATYKKAMETAYTAGHAAGQAEGVPEEMPQWFANMVSDWVQFGGKHFDLWTALRARLAAKEG